jgi:hypothetical protein
VPCWDENFAEAYDKLYRPLASDTWRWPGFFDHPNESPEIIGVLPYLIHPPFRTHSTASWIAFRDKALLPMMQQRPNDPNLPNFLKQVEAILTWRAGVSPQDRFWRAD